MSRFKNDNIKDFKESHCSEKMEEEIKKQGTKGKGKKKLMLA